MRSSIVPWIGDFNGIQIPLLGRCFKYVIQVYLTHGCDRVNTGSGP